MSKTVEERANGYIKGLEVRGIDIVHDNLYDASQVRVGYLAGYELGRLEAREELRRVGEKRYSEGYTDAEKATPTPSPGDPLMDVTASLAAAISLLRRGGHAGAAPSNKIYDQMLKDYQASVDRARKILREAAGG